MRDVTALLLGGVSALALGSASYAQDATGSADVQEVVVTGSRVITTGNAAPTPITVLGVDKLLEMTPSTVADALNRLPQFAAQPSARNISSAATVSSGAFLNLRRFGNNRNLVLIDGSRAPPTAATGAVDTNTIPTMLVQRVDVVTGGASAVYGSDAVSGVINYVIDKNFNGLKTIAQYGVSNYGDGDSWRFGIAGGKDLFEGRGHIEASYEHYNSKGIREMFSRPLGDDVIVIGGNGRADNPFRLVPNGRFAVGSPGGYIVNARGPTGAVIPAAALPAGLRDIAFKQDGVASPFIHGAPTGLAGLESGGDWGYFNQGTIQAPLRTNQAFARFDFDVTDSLHAYAQASYSDAFAQYPYISGYFLNSSVATGNPFIPASVQAAMTANNIQAFTFARVNDPISGLPGHQNRQFTTNTYLKFGLDGSLPGDFTWDANYGYSRSTQRVYNLNNISAEKSAAALDAVRDPATGRIVCQVSLTPFASRFPGCEPLNPFGPTSITRSAWDFVTDDTRYTLANLMHDANLSIAGSPFSLWAGPVRVALSGEYRWLSLRNVSNAEPAKQPDCAGLRVIGANCLPTTPLYSSNSTASMYASQNVKEAAAEVLIPLLSDVPFFQSLELNLAGRYTDYSTSGSVETWKIGGTWQVNDELRFRATRSKDIRAPTLQDLFAPQSAGVGGFTDLHTGISSAIVTYSQGNPTLTPEIGKTTTVGLVYQPNWLPRFSIAVDYFDIQMKNAITTQGPSAQNQIECEDSGGISPLCGTLIRPLPFSDRSAANFPLRGLSTGVNAQKQWTRGFDVEVNYRFDVADVISSVPGSVSIRSLAAYQPLLKTQTIVRVRPTEAAGVAGFSKLRLNTNLNYTHDGLSISLTHRWQSHQWQSDPRVNFDNRPFIKAANYFDASISYAMKVAGHDVVPFLTVENLFNRKPPVSGTNGNAAGLFYPTVSGFDVMGRYYTGGIRARF